MGALRDLISTIEATGGIRHATGFEGHTAFEPVAAPGWFDLALAYRAACLELGHAPLFADGPRPCPRFEIVERGDRRGIQCNTCGLVSWNPNDVAQHYCGGCHVFHDDQDLVARG